MFAIALFGLGVSRRSPQSCRGHNHPVDRQPFWVMVWRWCRALGWAAMGAALIYFGGVEGVYRQHLKYSGRRLPRFELDGWGAVLLGLAMVIGGALCLRQAWLVLQDED